MQWTSASVRRDDILRDFQFGCAGRSRGTDGGRPARRRTGGKEKRYQANSKKSKNVKFHRRENRFNENTISDRRRLRRAGKLTDGLAGREGSGQ
jgi:hypothetical protein